jgi:uncharacterized membrane protein
MYKIIGGDGKEYGPISAEQVRQWIAEGRANAQTPVQAAGSTEWKPLSSFPEFADALRSGRGGAGGDAAKMADDIIARGYEIKTGDWISRGLALVRENPGITIGGTSIGLAIIGIADSASIGLAGMVISGPIFGGIYLMFLKRVRGQEATIQDVFAGFSPAFLQLFLAGLVKDLLTGSGMFLCLIPGIYLAVAWVFTLFLVIDKRMEFWPAMETSRKVVTKNWFGMFVFMLACFGVNLLGALACGIGLLITMPITLGAIACAYEDIFVSPRS